MDLNNLPSAVQSLVTMGYDWDEFETFDYQAHGITTEHIPALIDIVRSAASIWEAAAQEEDAPEYWAPMHAWRALGQLQAESAIPDLVNTLRLAEDEHSDLAQEDLPQVFSDFGQAAVPALTTFLTDPSNSMWSRLAASDALGTIGSDHPESRAEVVRVLTQALERYSEESPTFNAFIISSLMDLKAFEAAPVVEQAYQAGRVEEGVPGDWEDFQVAVGLLPERTTPSPNYHADIFSDTSMDFPARPHTEERKTKQKRKQAEASRKKNRANKKKKKKK